MLCHNCRGRKSYLEALTPFQENPFASVFEQSVYCLFHDSPKPRQAVQQLHNPAKTQAVEIDTIRCRRNAFDQNLEPIPIFRQLMRYVLWMSLFLVITISSTKT